MNEPTVCCVLLTRDRPQMAARAVASFRAQTYERKRLLVVNSGFGPMFTQSSGLLEPCVIGADTWTIGKLRNWACDYADNAEIIAHWDDDDWSHPNRLAEQVALLQSSGADCVCYEDMLFWDTRPGHFCGSWLYTNHVPGYSIGSSMCYWRKAWERLPFEDRPTGEDAKFMAKVKTAGVSSIRDDGRMPPLHRAIPQGYEPRMICSIHGGNACNNKGPESAKNHYRRCPEWDSYCRERMKL